MVGAVYDPTRDEMYAGVVPGGPDASPGSASAWVNGERATVRDVLPGPASVVMLSSNLSGPSGKAPAWAGELMHQSDWKVRMLGSAQLEAALVGGGVADAAITIKGKLWDLVPAAAVVLGAGGTSVAVGRVGAVPVRRDRVRGGTGAVRGDDAGVRGERCLEQ